jgi:hypothetical protein
MYIYIYYIIIHIYIFITYKFVNNLKWLAADSRNWQLNKPGRFADGQEWMSRSGLLVQIVLDVPCVSVLLGYLTNKNGVCSPTIMGT